MLIRIVSTIIILLTLCLVAIGQANADKPADEPVQLAQASDQVAHGEYLVTIAGCLECHTPFQEQYMDFANLNHEQARTLAFFVRSALDDNRLFAGGRVFDLGPAGIVTARNLTSDIETGIGAWSDEEIKLAIRAGVSQDGRRLIPVMPYPLFNNMAESDLDAIVAYLRTLPPVRNEIPTDQNTLTMDGPPLPIRRDIVAPSPSDTAARGRYLMTGVLPCTDCHTPLDPATGQPVMEHYLSGGQPFEGPWGIVYGGNITPHETAGLGDQSDAEIKRAIIAGIRPDGRRMIVMPWQIFSVLTPQDLDATVHYLRHDVTPLEREAPAAAISDTFTEYVPLPAEETTRTGFGPALGIGAVLLILATMGAVLVVKRRAATP